MFLASPLCPTLLLCHVLFGFSSDELSVVPKVFCYLLNVSKFYIWVARNDFRFRGKHPSAVDVIRSVSSLVFGFTFPCFFVASVLIVVVVSSSVNGVLVVWWLLCVAKFSSFIFSFSPSCVFAVCPGLCWGVPMLLRWMSRSTGGLCGLPFALVLGHACPVVPCVICLHCL